MRTKPSRYDRYAPIITQTLVTTIMRPLFYFFLHLKVVGKEHISQTRKGMLVVSNHESELDPVLLPTILSNHIPLIFVSREQRFYRDMGLRGKLYGPGLFRLVGGQQVFVGKNNYEEALALHLAFLDHGHSVCIFPTGKKRPHIVPEEGRGGVGYKVLTTKRPILPIKIEGLYGITPRSFFLRKHYVTVRIGAPLTAEHILEKSAHIQTEKEKCIDISKNILEHISHL